MEAWNNLIIFTDVTMLLSSELGHMIESYNYMDSSLNRVEAHLRGGYDWSACRWRLLGIDNKKTKGIYNPVPRGYLHAAAALNHSLYAIFTSDDLIRQPVALP